MIDQRLYWIWLTGIPSIGPVMQKRLLKQFHSPEVIFRINPRELEKILGIGPALVDRIVEARSLEKSERILERMLKQNINLLTIENPLYPDKVKKISRAPVVLYYRGLIRENSMGVGVIGTRQCTSYGKQVAIETAGFLAKHQVPVISGMAKGIDGYAHTACLKAGGYTMAFLGSGVDICYPREHQSLMEAIIQKGAVLSLYPPGTPIYPHHFHQRNFLISAWSSKLLVVEAGEKSGTWSTVNHARILKREIWAVPNNIYELESRGTNQMIANGAAIFLNPQQLIPVSHVKKSPKTTNHPPSLLENSYNMKFVRKVSLTSFEKGIVEQLKANPMSIDQLAKNMKRSHSEIIETLSLLELESVIRIKPNQMIELI